MAILRPSAIVGQLKGKTQTAAFRKGKGGQTYMNNYVKRTSPLADVSSVAKTWMICCAYIVQWWSLLAKFGGITTKFGTALNALTRNIYPSYASDAVQARLEWSDDTKTSVAKTKIAANFDDMSHGQHSVFENVSDFLKKLGAAVIAKGTRAASYAVAVNGANGINVTVTAADGLTSHKVEVMAIDAATGKIIKGSGTTAAAVALSGFTAVSGEASADYGKLAGFVLVRIDGRPISATISEAAFSLTPGA